MYRTSLVGKVYSRLTVVRYVGRAANRHSIWLCKCSCGNFKEVEGSNLTSNRQKSCGCLRAEKKVKQGNGTSIT